MAGHAPLPSIRTSKLGTGLESWAEFAVNQANRVAMRDLRA
jgi:hypothetical protein